MYKLQVIVLSILLFVLVGCSTEQENLDVEVVVIRTFKISESAFVKYTVKNIGEGDIQGWNIYFRVSMESSKQIKAYDGLTYDLEPGQTSEQLIASGDIPDHFNDIDKPSLATLQLIEVY